MVVAAGNAATIFERIDYIVKRSFVAACFFIAGTINHIVNTGEGIISSILLALGCLCLSVAFYNAKWDKGKKDTSITFFVGENGTGKSTLLEAIAVAYGFNPEGGSKNYNFSSMWLSGD